MSCKKRKIFGGIILAALWVFCLSAVLLPNEALAEKVLWKFKIPVQLKEMPKSIEAIFVHWYIVDENNFGLANDVVEVPVNFEDDGTFYDNVAIKITDVDVDDPDKAYACIFHIELSQDGMSSYPPNAFGESWTNSKKGSNLVHVVGVKNLQAEKPQNMKF